MNFICEYCGDPIHVGYEIKNELGTYCSYECRDSDEELSY